MKSLRSMCAIACVCAIAATGTKAHAQGTARSMDFEQSIRTAGMGGAGVAVPWGVTSTWGNPATLGFAQGWGWDETRTQLVPGLASDVFLRTKRMTAGFGGVGVSWSGQPGGVGGLELDYGQSERTNESGGVLGSFGSYERVRSWGFGVSAATLADRFGKRTGERSIARYGDVAFGENFKDAIVALAPADLGGAARAKNHDWGVLARVSPSAFLRHGRDGVWDADVAFGHSVLNAGDELFVFLNEDQASPPSRIRRTGFAATASLAQPTAMHAAFEHLPILSALGPFVRLTVSFDHEAIVTGQGYDVDRSGQELSILGVVDLRHGHVKDIAGEIVDDTRGIGLCLPLGKIAAFRWDYAEVPQARDSGLPNVTRRSWSMWVNPAEIVRRGGR
ncbi:MAG: hypothetical protein HZA61_16905 [Candidatus Eisenbacteria bacterium]|uniref:PorV/PorQ family protein n=1 Tax=Eiseniibacteriota bacterium TaxID=2212470 RepID=A0A933SEY1_UNCEI|nr:hypothetical protein [Candidatus Eisenbacteria bacterium]